jgi:biotin carboxyl carrier protein
VEFRLRLGARTLDVRVLLEGDDLTATVEGLAHRVRRLGLGPRTEVCGTTVEEIALEIDGRCCRAVVARGQGRVSVALAGRVHVFETGDEARGTAGGAGSGSVTAPMPGKVVAVLVGVGDVVDLGQPLVVLEAMKMESTLTAEVAGRVTAVPAVAGGTVAAGDLLVEIAPAAE